MGPGGGGGDGVYIKSFLWHFSFIYFYFRMWNMTLEMVMVTSGMTLPGCRRTKRLALQRFTTSARIITRRLQRKRAQWDVHPIRHLPRNLQSTRENVQYWDLTSKISSANV
jgi:hypothetical protein